jgi:membrane protease YdiL (CAAX protease family)
LTAIRGTKTAFTALLLAFTFAVQPAFADTDLQPHYGWFSTEPRKDLERRRNLYLPPLASFLLPSFDQWWEGQHEAAGVYLATWLTGATLMFQAQQAVSKSERNSLFDDDQKVRDYTDVRRQFGYGAQLTLFAGEMSAYHSFRTAMKTRKQDGEFTFLTTDEDPGDLLLAPFAFSEALKPTTFLPLLLVAGLAIADQGKGSFTANDAAFVGGTSYNAGVGEEALFRGYFMPMFREGFGSNFWSNATTSVLFGAAHLGTVSFPLAQTAGGFYLGWLSQRNDWSLRQSIFIHAWWDVIALGAQVAHSKRGGYVSLPSLTIPF